MAVNEEYRQLEIAAELEELARTLAHSTRDVPHPRDSHSMLGELRATVAHLAQVCNQLAAWHKRTVDGPHYEGEDGDQTDSAHLAGRDLTDAAKALGQASSALGAAHSKNSVVRWYPDPQ